MYVVYIYKTVEHDRTYLFHVAYMLFVRVCLIYTTYNGLIYIYTTYEIRLLSNVVPRIGFLTPLFLEVKMK